MEMITKFYYTLNCMNMGSIKGKVDGNVFHLNANIILDYLGVPKEGDATYFDNVPSTSFLQFYLPEEKMIGTILKGRVKFKNPMKSKDLTLLALIFWQITVSNILP